jgi:hypothetical protein
MICYFVFQSHAAVIRGRLLTDVGIPNGKEMIEAVFSPEYNLFNMSLGVPTWCVFGYNVSTPYVVHYADGDWTTPTKIDVGEGDGTVPINGLVKHCQMWNATLCPILNMVTS